MVNCVVLNGRLTHSPELNSTKGGKSVSNFSLAVNGRDDEVSFVNCVAWGGSAEFLCKYFNKGDWVGIVGRLVSRKYSDKNGITHFVIEVFVEKIEFIGKKV